MKTDKTDWRIGAGGTSTGGTGPSTDHTHGDKTGKDSFFMNLECVVHFNKTHLPDYTPSHPLIFILIKMILPLHNVSWRSA